MLKTKAILIVLKWLLLIFIKKNLCPSVFNHRTKKPTGYRLSVGR